MNMECPFCGSKDVARMKQKQKTMNDILYESQYYECGRCLEQWQDGEMFSESIKNYKKAKGEENDK